MNNSRKALMFLSWLKVSYNSVLIKPKEKMQAVGIAMPTNKATLIVARIVQFHIHYPCKC
jgi:hypothetical protein